MSLERTSEEEQRTCFIILKEGDDKTRELFRLKKGSILEIKISSSLSWRKVRLFTNATINENDIFQRNNYQELKWIYPSNGKYDDSDRYISILCLKPGSFHYYFTIDGTT